MSRTTFTAVLAALLLSLSPAAPARAAAPSGDLEVHSASAWSDTALGLLSRNKKVIARCVVGFPTRLPLMEQMEPTALRVEISGLLRKVLPLTRKSCRATVQVTRAVARLSVIGALDERDFTFRDDSRVVDKPSAFNDCLLDVSVGDAVTGQVWRFKAAYTICHPATYSGGDSRIRPVAMKICTKGSVKPCPDYEGIPVCEDEPCLEIGQLFFSTQGRINVTWSGSADEFHTRWAVYDGGGGKHELTQRSRGSGQRFDKLGVGPAQRAAKYSVSIQGCRKRFLKRSRCGDWVEGWIVPKTGERYF